MSRETCVLSLRLMFLLISPDVAFKKESLNW